MGRITVNVYSRVMASLFVFENIKPMKSCFEKRTQLVDFFTSETTIIETPSTNIDPGGLSVTSVEPNCRDDIPMCAWKSSFGPQQGGKDGEKQTQSISANVMIHAV